MRILFLSPVANRSGSITTLLNYMQYAPAGRHEYGIFSRQAGSLSVGPEIPPFKLFVGGQADNFGYRLRETVYHKLTHRTFHENALLKAHQEFKPDLWYINTIVMPEYARLAVQMGIPYVLHVHELPQEYDLQSFEGFQFQLDHARQLLCASQTVVKNLNDMGYPNAILMHGLINVEAIQAKRDPQEMRRELGIPSDAFVWLMSGAWSPRKGFDFVPELMQHLPKDTHFLWMGPARRSGYTYYVERYIKTYGQQVHFLTEQAEKYFDYFNCCDAFALTSREDSYPIVMREAACLGKPIVGFSSGGITEFVREGMGEVVDGFDPVAMAAAMRRVMTGETRIDVARLKSVITPQTMREEGLRWATVLEEAPRAVADRAMA